MNKILIVALALLLTQTASGSAPTPPETSDQAGETTTKQVTTAEPSLWKDVVGFLDQTAFEVKGAAVTFHQLLIALILLVVGSLLVRYIAKYIGKRLLPKLGVDPGPAAAIQSIIFYVLLFAVVMTAFSMASVPMTVFTVFGGALALGVGFGSQNIMNNFISGLILLIERPVTVGQLIEVDGYTGTVLKIGARASLVEGYHGEMYIIPNSIILQTITKNWALLHDRIRSIVGVGVAYGSPTERVAELILKALNEHKKVLEQPAPSVLFTEFGDNSLNFEAHYWCRPRDGLDRRTIESDLRFAIDREFRDAGITIAFPQRDVHLDTLSPLEVRVTNG